MTQLFKGNQEEHERHMAGYPNIKNWVEKFDERFGAIKHRGFPQNAIKTFILQLLNEERERLVVEIEKLETTTPYFISKTGVLKLIRSSSIK